MAKKKKHGDANKRRIRLEKARHWLPTVTGTKVIRAYRKRYHVDVSCAVQDLQELGYNLPPGYAEAVLKSAAGQIQAAQQRRKAKTLAEEYDEFQDDMFSYIAGYTFSCFAYGVTWEEMEDLEGDEKPLRSSEPAGAKPWNDGDDIPF